MPARIKMLVTVEPVEVWVELPDYVDEGIGQAGEDAARMLVGQETGITLAFPDNAVPAVLTYPTVVSSAEPVFLGPDSFVIDGPGEQ